MTRETVSKNKIALLATGDEISNGDILNTNSQEIAKRLFINGMHIGMHMAAPDNMAELENAIRFLLHSHRALIITGGLGPTSDDLTRFALSKAINQPLVFNETTWTGICQLFKRLGYTSTPETNRQQALFPENAMIIANPNGTAAGCLVETSENLIFMLPGPPLECLPMVDEVVLTTLKKKDFQEVFDFEHWLLFGVSEGKIAEELDQLAKPYDVTTGYRLAYPYIEVKLYSNNQKDFLALLPTFKQAISSYLIDDGKVTASTLLQNKLSQLDFELGIVDLATGGLLENTIKTPLTSPYVNFASKNPHIEIRGLDDYWQGNLDQNVTEIEIHFLTDPLTHIKKNIPFRGHRVKLYAVEFICQQIWQFLARSDVS